MAVNRERLGRNARQARPLERPAGARDRLPDPDAGRRGAVRRPTSPTTRSSTCNGRASPPGSAFSTSRPALHPAGPDRLHRDLAERPGLLGRAAQHAAGLGARDRARDARSASWSASRACRPTGWSRAWPRSTSRRSATSRCCCRSCSGTSRCSRPCRRRARALPCRAAFFLNNRGFYTPSRPRAGLRRDRGRRAGGSGGSDRGRPVGGRRRETTGQPFPTLAVDLALADRAAAVGVR